MKYGCLVAYRIHKKKGKVGVTKLWRDLYGYKDTSNYGQYVYHRKGLLDKIPSRKLIRGVLIVGEKDRDKLIDVLKKRGAEFYPRKIFLDKKDKKILRK